MDLDEVITVTKLSIQDQQGYLMIAWQPNSFEMYLYLQKYTWKGFFSSKRLAGFSKNLQMPENEYYNSLKRCLTEDRNDYTYELTSGFFYWKRRRNNSLVMEGFLPLDIDTSSRSSQPDIVEVLISLNKHLKQKATDLQNKYNTIKLQYYKCLKDTEEFLGLKMEMERSLCEKFLVLINLQKADGEKCNEIS